MTYPSDPLTYPDAPRPHRGWVVMAHAVERFCERVAAVPFAEAAAWLAEHAHEAINTGQRTFRGDRLYRLAHPWDGPDAVLVVRTDPDGTRAVVTCGWWDETADETEPVPVPAPQPRHVPTAPPAPLTPTQSQSPAPRPAYLPPRPDGLAEVSPSCLGARPVRVDRKHQCVAVDALSVPEMRVWVAYLTDCIHAYVDHHGTAPPQRWQSVLMSIRSRLAACDPP